MRIKKVVKMTLSQILPKEKGLVMIVGKGGVGKTTFSAILSIYASKQLPTFVTSIDPAHHLGDVLGYKLEHREKRIAENLIANEADIDELIREYLSKSINLLKNSYKDITALNLDKYFDTLKDSPGIEIEAMLHYIVSLVRKVDEYKYIIVDTPATSITSRLIGLPWVQGVWVDNLIDLRSKIAGLKEVIESVKAGKKVTIDDKILKELIQMREEIERNKKLFMNSDFTKIIGVTTTEKLPIVDLERLSNSLKNRGIKISSVVINKYKKDENGLSVINYLKEKFPEARLILVPQMNYEVISIEKIEKVIEKIEVL
ncbi:ArsA family ATPase [Fervidicoccus fontis]|nr:ArsA family ATPase [Fervidicoccus fontis]MBE9391381.1 ArsA family ATPase [Fervidicoccus fontis]PMB75598.1 MAG: hypothetical protein C0188_02450 [Fervidicoccus fontis]